MASATSEKPVPVTVIMLTLNEEFNLPGAIENVKDWAEDVFIVDSCSTDRTVDIALENGIKIVQRPFTNFGDQWNFALEKLPIRTPWTFKLDPDERLTPEIKEEIRVLLAGEPRDSGFMVRLRLWFMGRALHASSPMLLRLWRTGKCRFTAAIVNEHPSIEGSVGKLKSVMQHLDSSNLHAWYDKQNIYTTMEAIMATQEAQKDAVARLFGSRLERQVWRRRYLEHVPFLYQLHFLYLLARHHVWLDGMDGLTWAHMRVEVLRMCLVKAREIRRSGRIPPVPRAPRGGYDERIANTALQKAVGGR